MENNEWNDYKSFTVKAGTTSDWSEIILRMAEGNTTIKIAGVNNENNAAVLIVKAVTKSDNGGTNILNVGNCGQMTIKESIDFAGNITIGSKSKLVIGDTVTGQNINQTIKLGGKSTFTAGNIDLRGGKNTISAGAKSVFNVTGSVRNVFKLNLSSGKAGEVTTGNIAGDYICAMMDNSITLGNWANLVIGGKIDNGGIASATGTTIKLGSNARLTAAAVQGILNFTVGNYSTVEIKTVDAENNDIFGEIAGTVKNNKINAGSNVVFKAANINLAGGNDTIVTGSDTAFTAGNISNVENITVGAKNIFTAVSIDGINKLTLKNGSKIANGSFTARAVEGTEKADNFNFGSWNNAAMASIDMAAGKNVVTIGSFSNVTVTGAVSSLHKLNIKNGNADNRTAFAAGIVSGTEYNDNFNIGNWATVKMESVDLAAGKNVITIGNYSDVNVAKAVSNLHKLTLKAGKAPGKDNDAIWTNFSAAEGIYGTEYNDSVNIGNWCKAAISNIDMLEGKNTFVCGRYSDVAVDGDIVNVYKLTVNAGSAEYQTRFSAGAVIGSANNDSVTFGNWSSGEIDSITFADGNDQLKIGDNSKLTVDFLDFGNGSKDTMSLGKNAVLTLTDEITAWVDLNVLNAGKGSEIWTRTQIDFEDTTGSFQNATLYHECSFDFDENAAGLLVDELYSNEYDIWSFTADKSGSMSFEVINGEDILVECRNAAGEWMDYSSMWSMGVVAGESYEIRVSCEGDYKDKYEKKEYAITATIA